MKGSGLTQLRALLTERYDALKAQIAHRLGTSGDIAGDALHDAYLRLASRDGFERIEHKQAYLVNTAINSVIDKIRRDTRKVDMEEIDGIFELASDLPGPAQVAEDRNEIERLLRVLEQLPTRQSALLFAYRVEGVDTEVLARRWGISRVMVRREIQAAHRFCLAAMDRADLNEEAP